MICVKGRGHISWDTEHIIGGIGWPRGRSRVDQLEVELGFRIVVIVSSCSAVHHLPFTVKRS